MRLISLLPAAVCTCTTMACAVPDDENTQVQAVTGDFANIATRYGWSGLAGNSSYPQALIGMKVASGDFGNLETKIFNETGISCTRANFCLKIVDRADGTTLFPATTDSAELEKVAEGIAGLLRNGQSAPIIFVDGTASDATNLNASYTTIGTEFAAVTGGDPAGVLTQTYTIASGSQSTVTSWLADSHHLGVVPAVPNGYLVSIKAVQVGGTQDSAGSDVVWSSQDGGDVMALMHNLVFPWGTKDSPYFAAGSIASRLNNQPGAPATRAVLLATSNTHFTKPAGTTSTRGIFVDGSSL